MEPQLQDIPLAPGFYTEQTARGAVNRFKGGDKVRFRNGLPEKLGGWVLQPLLDGASNPATIIGNVRAVHEWSSLDNQKWIAIGTEFKVYVINQNNLYDVTPLKSGTAGTGTITNPFSTTSGHDTVNVNHPGHGEQEGDYVHFSGASTVGGLTLNGQFTVTAVVDVNNYTITAASTATSTVTNAGGTVTYQYEIDIQPAENTSVLGWSIGGYSTGSYSTPRPNTDVSLTDIRIWSLDNWGEDLICSPRGGSIYTWDRSLGTTVRATLITQAPPTANRVIVSDQDRHLIAIGGYNFDASSQDQALVQWCDQEDYTNWTSTITNSAGDKRIDGGSFLITGIRTRGGTLLFTNESLYMMTWVGGNDVFAFNPIGESVSIASPNAAAEAGGIVYFMSQNDFYYFDGDVHVLPCDVRAYVFNNMNQGKIDRVYCSVNRLFNEVIWLYPSLATIENDSYVIFNYKDKCWYFGTLSRTAFHDYGPSYSLPFAFDSNGNMYLHESGVDDDVNPMLSSLETWDIELDGGNEFTHGTRFVPDFEQIIGSVDFYLDAKRYPQDTYIATKGPYNVTSTTTKIDTRVRGRQISIRMETSNLGDWWRQGTWRAGGRVHGKR